MQKKIIFIKPAFSACFGSFGVDDIGYFDADVAAHFVNDAQCAKYAPDATAPAEPAAEALVADPVPADEEPAAALLSDPVPPEEAPTAEILLNEPPADDVQASAPKAAKASASKKVAP